MRLMISDIKWDKPKRLTNKECGLPERIVLDDPDQIRQLLEDVDTDAGSLYGWLFKTYGCQAKGFTLDAEQTDRRPWLTNAIK